MTESPDPKQAYRPEPLAPISMKQASDGGGLRFSIKDVLLTVVGTALALGSLKAEDPWVVIPMLLLAGATFIVICALHAGRPTHRLGTAIAILLILAFIGWRDLRKPEQIVQSPRIPLAPGPPPTINQSAQDSPCANQVAQAASEIDCSAEKEKHDKAKTKN